MIISTMFARSEIKQIAAVAQSVECSFGSADVMCTIPVSSSNKEDSEGYVIWSFYAIL